VESVVGQSGSRGSGLLGGPACERGRTGTERSEKPGALDRLVGQGGRDARGWFAPAPAGGGMSWTSFPAKIHARGCILPSQWRRCWPLRVSCGAAQGVWVAGQSSFSWGPTWVGGATPPSLWSTSCGRGSGWVQSRSWYPGWREGGQRSW